MSGQDERAGAIAAIRERWARSANHYPASLSGYTYEASCRLADEAQQDIAALLAELDATEARQAADRGDYHEGLDEGIKIGRAEERAGAERLHAALQRLIEGKPGMCLPARRDDDDLLISDAIAELVALRQERARYGAVVAATRALVNNRVVEGESDDSYWGREARLTDALIDALAALGEEPETQRQEDAEELRQLRVLARCAVRWAEPAPPAQRAIRTQELLHIIYQYEQEILHGGAVDR